ncbi:tRNA (adenosine(37)-N6)-threonylcarbamoyltransferase complex ATPase subunit type 1 TsaE [Myxococcota bacterium]
MNLTLTTKSPEQTRELGRKLGELCRPGDWIGLTGELGAGKTCLVTGLARGLQVPDGYQVTSPTFIIHQTYPGKFPLHHLDLYRLHEGAELIELGYRELLEGDGVCAVEWCEQVPGAIPDSGVIVKLELEDETTRTIEITKIDKRGEDLLSGLQAKL